jgi:pimeloyl-ACP methyl ester carboxylesterase
MRTRLHADEGSGPPLVYVPGIDGSGEFLLGQAEVLAQRLRLLRLRHEGADPDRDGYQAMADDVVEVIAGAGIGRALLLAESFGGGIALQAALDHADRVAGLALVNTFPRFGHRTRLALTRAFAPLVPQPVFRRARQRFAAWSLFGRHRDPDAIRRFRSVPASRFDGAYRRRLQMIATLDLRSRLPQIRQPVALFAGTDDRVVDSVRQARAMAALLPDATVEIIDGGGHLILPLDLPWTDWFLRLAERAGLR